MEIRPYEDGDELNFIDLDLSLEEHPWNRRDLNNWHWKYKGNNPFGSSESMYCYLKNELIGHFAFIPLNYLSNGKIVQSANSIAMMVRDDFQNKGLIKYIGDKLFKVADRDIDFIYGIPNQRSYDLHKVFFKYEDWMILNFYFAKIDEFEKFNLTMSDINEIDNFDYDYENFWNRAKLKYDFILDRNKEYMNWRYLDRKDTKYLNYKLAIQNKIYAYISLKIYKEEKIKKGHIMDIITIDNNDDLNNLIFRYIINIFIEKKVDVIFFYSEIVENLEDQLKQKLKVTYKRNLIFRKNPNKNFNLVPNNKLSNFSMGDSLEIF